MKPIFSLPELGYEYTDLEPMMSAKTLATHHGKHLKTYIDNLNQLVPGTEWEGLSLEDLARKATGTIGQNAGQAWNHQMFFAQFKPEKSAKSPSEELLNLIEQSYGTMEIMQHCMNKAATTLFGSGWAWLIRNDKGKLEVKQLANDDNPLRHNWKPIMTVDVWEHAYYLDYQNRRAEYVTNFWLLLNWRVLSERIK